MAIGVQATFDAHDPGRLAAFWGEALGYTEQPPPPGFATWEDFGRHIDLPEERWGDFAALVDSDGVGPRLFFQRVPEGKTVKNRVHLDVNAGHGAIDRRAAIRSHMSQLVAAGATVVREMQEESGWWIVLADPEGNEFCLQ